MYIIFRDIGRPSASLICRLSPFFSYKAFSSLYPNFRVVKTSNDHPEFLICVPTYSANTQWNNWVESAQLIYCIFAGEDILDTCKDTPAYRSMQARELGAPLGS